MNYFAGHHRRRFDGKAEAIFEALRQSSVPFGLPASFRSSSSTSHMIYFFTGFYLILTSYLSHCSVGAHSPMIVVGAPHRLCTEPDVAIKLCIYFDCLQQCGSSLPTPRRSGRTRLLVHNRSPLAIEDRANSSLWRWLSN